MRIGRNAESNYTTRSTAFILQSDPPTAPLRSSISTMGSSLHLPFADRLIGSLPLSDVALAVALAVLAVGGLLTHQVVERPLGVTIPVALISTAMMALRRKIPLTAVAVVASLAIAQGLLAGHASHTLWSLVVFLLSAYTVAAECSEGYALIGLGLVLASQFLSEWLEGGTDYPFDALVFGGVWLFGRGTRSWKEQAIRAEQHRYDLARIAVAEERTRIARELHDVVAHSLSVIAVQADAAEAALLKDPARAIAPMQAIRGSARDALGDMRQLLRVLRVREDSAADPTVGDLGPAHGLDDLPRLLATMNATGLDLHAEVADIGQVSRGTGLTVFRIVQEALTNVRKHAGNVPTRLCICRDADQLTIQIENAAPSHGQASSRTPGRGERPSTGNGLLGMSERVQAAGGTLHTGPTKSGGFRVLVTLPVEQ